jgi:uncharacterized protein with von Willebrand factor type A (vWA) domain
VQSSNLPRNLLVFGRVLRRVGIDVHIGRLLDVMEALQHVDLGSRDQVYYTCRALLVYRADQIPLFDRAFDAFWLGRIRVGSVSDGPGDAGLYNASAKNQGPAYTEPSQQRGTFDKEFVGPDAAATRGQDAASAGDLDVLADKDFSEFTQDEVALARVALDRLVWTPGERRTRRWVAGHGSRIDLRRAFAKSLRTGGDVVVLPRRRRRTRTRPLVLLCDVSGSMERYSRMLLHFVHALSRRHRRVEVFLFSTRLTRITLQLRGRRLDQAITAVARAVPDWSGGTRIGGAIVDFRRHWARRVLRGGPVVLLISDGWDRGDPIELRDQVAWLQRSCHRLIWLNPLIGTVGYAPLTRGLQAALPFVDDFLAVRTLSNLADLALHLNTLAAPTRPRSRWTSPVLTASTPRPNASGTS